VLPNFLDIFAWSIPFVSEKIMEMLYKILNTNVDDVVSINHWEENPNLKDLPFRHEEELKRSNTESITSSTKSMHRVSDEDPRACNITNEDTKKKYDIIRNRIKFLGKMMKMMKTLREQNETVIKLKQLTPDNKIPQGLLVQGTEALNDYYEQFTEIKETDAINERMPGT
jgi:serine/threonine-protein phosphatase 2B catalytic subunit